MKYLLPAILLLVAGIVLAFWMTVPEIPPAQPGTPEHAQPMELWQPPPPPSDGYLGSQSCVECHAEIHQSYQSHPMAHALAPVLEAAPLEDYAHAEFEPVGRQQYRIEKTATGVLHHEFQQSPAGEMLYDQAVPVEFAVGSGKRGRSYLIHKHGMFFQSPITWYSGKQVWDLSPGYRPGSHKRFERRVIDGCIVCHSGRANFDAELPNHYGNPPFLEQAIGCENCHGPGRDHIAWHRQTEPAGTDPIINPSKLQPELREAVCNQCHLPGEERILQYQRRDQDFRPGMPLEEVWAVFVQGHGAEGETTRAVSHVEQMRSSNCYTAGDHRLSCVSCHDPHSYPSPAERVDYYRSRCLKCHDSQSCQVPLVEREQGPHLNSCIACHMPKLQASDVPHTTQTDHRILRKPRPATELAATGPARLFDDAARSLTPLQRDRATGLFKSTQAELQQSQPLALEVVELLEPVRRAAPDDLPVLHALASAFERLERDREAEKLWLELLRRQPRHEEALRRLAMFYHDRNQPQLALPHLERYLAINPWNADMQGRHAHLLGQQGDYDRAIEAARRSLEINPSVPALYGWLSEIYSRINQPEAAARNREIFQKIRRPGPNPSESR